MEECISHVFLNYAQAMGGQFKGLITLHTQLKFHGSITLHIFPTILWFPLQCNTLHSSHLAILFT